MGVTPSKAWRRAWSSVPANSPRDAFDEEALSGAGNSGPSLPPLDGALPEGRDGSPTAASNVLSVSERSVYTEPSEATEDELERDIAVRSKSRPKKLWTH